MTRLAKDKRDGPISEWIRAQKQLDSIEYKMDVTDIDFTFHKYLTQVDGCGTRHVKLIQDVEWKSWGKKLSVNQLETLYFRHQLLNKKSRLISNRLRKRVYVWYFGQFVCLLYGGNAPDACQYIEWCGFDGFGVLRSKEISAALLVDILGFKIRPDNLTKMSLRRHHKTSLIGYEDHSKDLLFPVAKYLIKRS